MTRMCAWCGVDLDDGRRAARPDGPITHGICGACKFSILHEGGMTLLKFLEKLQAPVLLVTGDVVVDAANSTACSAIGKRIEEIEGHLGGTVLDCLHARQPEGCGRTVHCVGCQIRASVGRTFRTGEALVRVEAFQDVWTPQGAQRRRLLISTEQANEKVLLRVDAMETTPNEETDRTTGARA